MLAYFFPNWMSFQRSRCSITIGGPKHYRKTNVAKHMLGYVMVIPLCMIDHKKTTSRFSLQSEGDCNTMPAPNHPNCITIARPHDHNLCMSKSPVQPKHYNCKANSLQSVMIYSTNSSQHYNLKGKPLQILIIPITIS